MTWNGVCVCVCVSYSSQITRQAFQRRLAEKSPVTLVIPAARMAKCKHCLGGRRFQECLGARCRRYRSRCLMFWTAGEHDSFHCIAPGLGRQNRGGLLLLCRRHVSILRSMQADAGARAGTRATASCVSSCVWWPWMRTSAGAIASHKRLAWTSTPVDEAVSLHKAFPTRTVKRCPRAFLAPRLSPCLTRRSGVHCGQWTSGVRSPECAQEDFRTSHRHRIDHKKEAKQRLLCVHQLPIARPAPSGRLALMPSPAHLWPVRRCCAHLCD